MLCGQQLHGTGLNDPQRQENEASFGTLFFLTLFLREAYNNQVVRTRNRPGEDIDRKINKEGMSWTLGVAAAYRLGEACGT
jgi:hypothetical protein